VVSTDSIEMKFAEIKFDTAYHPRGLTLWFQVFLVSFFFLFGGFVIIAAVGSSAVSICVLLGGVFFALAIFFLLNLIGFRSQYLMFRTDGISFRLPSLNQTLLMPWKLQSKSLPWSAIHALDVKLQNLGGSQKAYVLRTSMGDVRFSWPQWPDAEQIAAEILTRSAAPTSVEDMDLPPALDPTQPQMTVPISLGERLMRRFGTVLLIISSLLALICLIALFSARPDDRWAIAKALFFLGMAMTVARGLRRYRRIR
jgi:hypothetical protein